MGTTGDAATGWSPDVQATFCATVVDEWVRCGLTDAVVAPGSRSTPLAMALVDDERVRVHVHVDERSASFMALGLASVTERAVVVLATSGTATVEFHPAVVEADLGAVPLLVCTADRPLELRDVAAPQTVDQERLYGRSTRWYVDTGVPDGAGRPHWRSLASRAWSEATGARPGPVQVNLPFREPLLGRAGPLPPARGSGPWHRRVAAPPEAPVLEADVAAARGVVVAGRGTPDPDAVVALAEDLGWPLLADPLSGCRGPAAVVAFDALLRTPFAQRVVPEVVLRTGAPPASKVLGQWLADAGAHELVVAVERWWPDPAHAAAVLLDAVPVVAPGHRPVTEWREVWQVADRLAQGAVDEVLAAEPLGEPSVVRHLTRTLRPGTVLAVSSSMPVRDLEWFGTGRADLRYLANRGANGIDGVVSTAVGAALSGARTVLVVGDLAFLHDSNGLLGLVDRDVDLTVVVLDNDGGGIFSFLPQHTELERDRYEMLWGTPHGLDLVAVSEAFGVPATRATAPADLEWRPGTRVVVVPGDRTANLALHRRLDEAVADALTT